MKQLARTPSDIGHAIRSARKAQNLSQSELAAKSGLWQETISKIETGTANGSLDTIFSVLAALELEIHVEPRSKGSATSFEDIF
ncbi:helix-turn-helix domain-containing protein [Flexibacterium corallicola]|uniref:helix-turn-helix domain-containing protein n=1 Tax=Flexibacterium corallicola TaxID=3037259 RepID=UPI00286F4281|nr:helix-turn-helix transcriptional regulator [Pseudovibrio sp. M1P-2-3]